MYPATRQSSDVLLFFTIRIFTCLLTSLEGVLLILQGFDCKVTIVLCRSRPEDFGAQQPGPSSEQPSAPADPPADPALPSTDPASGGPFPSSPESQMGSVPEASGTESMEPNGVPTEHFSLVTPLPPGLTRGK